MLLLLSLTQVSWGTRLGVLPPGEGWLLLQELLSAALTHVPLASVFQPGIQVRRSCDADPA